jgi:hypothetical protein
VAGPDPAPNAIDDADLGLLFEGLDRGLIRLERGGKFNTLDQAALHRAARRHAASTSGSGCAAPTCATGRWQQPSWRSSSPTRCCTTSRPGRRPRRLRPVLVPGGYLLIQDGTRLSPDHPAR